jgi:hypothetical protein
MTTNKDRAELKNLTNQLIKKLKAHGVRDPLGAAMKFSAAQARKRVANTAEEVSTERQRQRDELAARMGVIEAKNVVLRETNDDGITTAMSFSAASFDRSAR